MKKLFLLGDSIAKGVIYKGELGTHSYGLCPAESELPFSERQIALVNRSRMGATVGFCHDNFDRLTAGLAETPDDLLFSYGGNDSDHDWAAVSAAPTAAHAPKTSPEAFCEMYTDAIRRAQAAGAGVALTNLLPIDAEKYFAHISRRAAAANGTTAKTASAGILSWLGDVSMLYRFHEYYNTLVMQVASVCGCPVIDVRSAFLLQHGFGSLLCADGIHPTVEGHRLYRETVATAISAL